MKAVLVLDDDPAVRLLMSRSLASAGVDVVSCHEIEAAEAMLDCRTFEAVVTDLAVSERGGLEGMRLIRHVAAQYPETRVVAISGVIDDRIDSLGQSMGAHAVLQKPVDLRTMHEAVLGTAARAASPGRVLDLEPLDAVLRGSRIRAVLQPICEVAGAGPYRVHAVEALARVVQESPLYNPGLLFEYAVRKDRVFEVDRRCISAALNEAQFLPEGTRLFVNAHPQSMQNPQFASVVTEMVRQAGIDSSRVVIEVTEQHTIGDPHVFARKLDALRERGFGLALDDYGSGFANLHLLMALKPEYLKLSGLFLKGIDADPRRRTIVAATADMANRLGIPVIVEWLETEAQRRVVAELGIPFAQGYYLAQPAPAASLLQSDMVTFEPSAAAGIRS